MTISDLCKAAYENAKDKGFWENPRTELECYALIISEVAEAIEEARTNNPDMYVSTITQKPEGRIIELADAVIRIADLCGAKGWDLQTAIGLKMQYNLGRPKMHGKLA